MEYRFAKTLYEQLRGADYESWHDIAQKMIEYGREQLGEEKIRDDYYDSATEPMRLLREKYRANEVLPENDRELEKELLWEKEAESGQCVFLTFLMIQVRETDKKRKEARESGESRSDSYKREYVNILNNLYRALGRDALVNSCMDDAILYFCLATRQPWKVWVDLQAEWNRQRKEDEDWHNRHAQWRQLSYFEFKETVSAGLSEDNRKTQNTYLEADKKLNEIIDSYNGGSGMEVSISAVFPRDVLRAVENAEWRRTWYLYRMISMVVDSQIETIIQHMRSWKISGNKVKRNELEKAVDHCWLRTNLTKIQALISKASDAKEAERDLRSYLRGCSLTAEKIANSFNRCLGRNMGPVFVRAKYRCPFHFWEQLEMYDDNPRNVKVVYRNMIQTYFRTNKDVHHVLQGSEYTKGGERNARLFCKIMSGEAVTTKEMLLLTALVVKAQDCEEITREYIITHVLRNCRFDIELSKERPFNRFFLDSFSHIKNLHNNAMELEMDMLKCGKGAVFYNIIRGKEI